MRVESFKILAVGDILLADTPLKLGRGVRSYIVKNGNDYYIDRLKAITNGHDICFGNLESVLSNCDRNRLLVSSIEMRGDPEFVEILKNADFNVVNVANNHIFQHGINSYTDTVMRLERNGILVVGDGSTHPGLVVYKLGLTQIGFVGYSMHHEQYRPDETCPYALREDKFHILNEIERIRDCFEGFLVCSLHWGFEFVSSTSSEQRDFCHGLVDNGVNLVLGHHSHVPQAVENYKGALIAYSLGNFIFDMDSEITKRSFALSIIISRNEIMGSNMIPYEIRDDYCPYLLTGQAKINFLASLNVLSLKVQFENCQSDQELKLEEKEQYKKIYTHDYRNFFQNIIKINPWYTISLMLRAILRRIGLLYNP